LALLVVGDITIDSLGNRYVVTEAATFIEEFGGEFVGRRDLVDGEAVGRTYYVEAASSFMFVPRRTPSPSSPSLPPGGGGLSRTPPVLRRIRTPSEHGELDSASERRCRPHSGGMNSTRSTPKHAPSTPFRIDWPRLATRGS